MSEKIEETAKTKAARENFLTGANCAQAVLKAFGEETGLGDELSLKLASSFGGGMGRMRKTCGALTAAFMVAGIIKGCDNLNDIGLKGEHYALVQRMAKEFEKAFGTTECKDILKTTDTSPYPTPRTDDFYKTRPCGDIIAFSASLVEKFVFEKKGE